MKWDALKKDLTLALSQFDRENGWIEKVLDYRLVTLPDLSKITGLAEIHAAVMDEDAFALFDNDKMHNIAYQGTKFSRDTAFSWLVRRGLRVGADVAVDDLRRYIESSTVTAYQVVFVDGLYCENSDDEVNFSDEIRICHLMHAPVQQLQSQAFHRRLLGEKLDYIIYAKIATERQITTDDEERDLNALNSLPNLEPIEDRVSLLSLVARSGFQIAMSSIVIADDVPVSDHGFSYSAHSRRTPVPMAPGVIALHTRQAEELYQKFSALSAKSQKRIRVPLRKLNDCLSEHDQVQQMIDLRTCLKRSSWMGTKMESSGFAWHYARRSIPPKILTRDRKSLRQCVAAMI